jgi:peptidoglycan hydrolase CwlO-like protein
MKFLITIILTLLVIASYTNSADVSIKEYMDTSFRNTDSNISQLRQDIQTLSSKIDNNTDEMRRKNDNQDTTISESCAKISSLESSMDILIKILIGSGATGVIGGGIGGGMALIKRQARKKANCSG